MIIDKITLYNFKKYKKTDIEFEKSIVGIFGNNGVGKSTIFDGITWVLYGKTQSTDVSGVNQADLIRDGEERMGVELFFSLNGNRYRVSKYLDSSGTTTKLWMNDKVQGTQTRQVRRMVKKILGLDAKAFVASSFIRQKELDLLSSKTPSERKGIINRLFNLRIYEKFEKLAKEKKKAVRGERRSLSGKKEIFESEIERIGELCKEKEMLEKKFKEISNEYKKFEDKLQEKKAKLEELEKEKKIYDESVKKEELLSEKRKSKKERLKELKGDLKEIEKLEKEYEKKLPEYKEYKELKKSFKKIESKKDEYTQLKNSLEIEKNKLETDLKNIEANIEKTRETLKNNKKEIEVCKEKVKKLPEIRKKTKKYDEIKLTIEKHENDVKKLQKKINELDQHLTKHETEKKNLEEDLDQIEGVGVGKKCPLCKRKLDEEHYTTLTAKYNKKIKEKNNAIAKISKKKRNAQDLLEEKENTLQKFKSELQEIEELREKENDLKIYETTIERLKKEIEKLQKEIKNLKNDKEELLDKKSLEIKAIKKKIKDIGFKEEKYSQMKKKLEEKEEIEKKIPVLKEKISQKVAVKKKIASLNEKIRSIEKNIQHVHSRIDEKEKYAKEYEELKKEMEPLQKKYVELSKEHSAKSTEIKNIQERINELEEKKKKLKDIEVKIKDKKEKEREYSILCEAFSDIPVNIQNRLKPRIALETSQLVDEMTDGKYSEIELDDDYGILVRYDGELHPISRFSGGEKDLINLCLRIAISRVLVSLSSKHGFSHIQSLFLDEVFSSLDTERRQNLLKTLHKLQNHFEQILIISHVKDIKTSIPHTILVEETPEGYSTVTRD